MTASSFGSLGLGPEAVGDGLEMLALLIDDVPQVDLAAVVLGVVLFAQLDPSSFEEFSRRREACGCACSKASASTRSLEEPGGLLLACRTPS